MRSALRIVRSGLALRPRDRRLALGALAALVAARLTLAAASYATVRRFVSRTRQRHRALPISAEECRRAVERAARLIPSTSCLPRAIAAEYLLRRAGLPATMLLGARLDARGDLHAHAWVESNGVSITGGEVSGYVPFSPPRRP